MAASTTSTQTPRAAGALEVRDLEVGYGATFRMSGITLRVEAGEVLGVLGPNGGGKSTLLKSVAGVLPLQGGSVSLDGRPLREQAGRVAFVPQREEVNWDFPVTALDVVLMGRFRSIGWLRNPGRGDREAAGAALARFGLGGLGERHISQFSGGQQQRIFLARALAQQPAVVLLDEPFTGIDQENREVFREAVRDFAAAGAVVLMATHDLDEVTRGCDAVCFLNRRLVAFGPTASTYTPENLRATFEGQVAVFP